ncbi:MAG: hypothetical protein JKX85_05230 [Phycisphaeraceae bacterium]|nr:hypothetical protein [Phycisphaeraceae bacterium]
MAKSNHIGELGDKVKCKITGFTGIITTVASHLAGCDRIWVSPPIDKDGKSVDGCWLDIDMVEIIKGGAVASVVYKRDVPGGIDLPKSK